MARPALRRNSPPGAPACGVLPRLAAGLLTLGLAAPALAARFGVYSFFPPKGYFILTGPQTPIGVGNFSWGDNRHRLDFHIEVTGTTLRVELFDPGLVSASPGNFDLFFNGVVGQVTYRLEDPGGAPVASLAFGPDTEGPGGSNLALVVLYDGPAAPGVYRLHVTMDDTATADEDIDVFGILVPGYDFYSYWFTGGVSNGTGANIIEPLTVYPWVVRSTPLVFLGEPSTGLDVLNHDLDSALGAAPPAVRIVTPSNRTADPLPSVDAGLATTNLRGLEVSGLDCSDYGMYQLRVSSLSAAMEGPLALNVFSAQLAAFGAGIPPADFPVGAGDLRDPVRLYYPRDDLSSPRKERLVHTGRVAAGSDPPEAGFPSEIEVTVRLENPTPYDLTGIAGRTSLTADTQFSDPAAVQGTGGLSVTVSGRDLDFTGTVLAGQTGTVVYRTTLTAAAPGTFYVTGDGTDFNGGASPTYATYATPFAPPPAGERVGPICMLRATAVPPVCAVTPRIDGPLAICEGETITLDASGTVLRACAGGPEYRWSRDGVEMFPFPGPPAVTDAPAASAVYEVEVRCSADPACAGTASVTVVVTPRLPPPGVGNTLLAVRESLDDVHFTWTTNGSPWYNLRRFDALPLDRLASTLLASPATGDHLAAGEVLTAPPAVYYQALAVNCAGEE